MHLASKSTMKDAEQVADRWIESFAAGSKSGEDKKALLALAANDASRRVIVRRLRANPKAESSFWHASLDALLDEDDAAHAPSRPLVIDRLRHFASVMMAEQAKLLRSA